MSYLIQCPECKAEWIPLDKVSPEFKFNLLKAENTRLQKGLQWSIGFEQAREHYISENARLREALAVYADPEYWRATKGDDQEYLFIESIGKKEYVQGKVARAALEGKE